MFSSLLLLVLLRTKEEKRRTNKRQIKKMGAEHEDDSSTVVRVWMSEGVAVEQRINMTPGRWKLRQCGSRETRGSGQVGYMLRSAGCGKFS